MSTSTNVDIAVDGTQAMTLLINGIESIIPSQDPIVVNIRNQMGCTMQVVQHVIDHGEIELEPNGSLSGDLAPDNDLIFGMKSKNAGTKGLILLASDEAQTINGIESYILASFFCQHTYWGTKGVNGAVINVPSPLYRALEKNLSGYAGKLMDEYASAKQTQVFQNPSNAPIKFSGEMAKVTSPAPQNKQELNATFNMGV